ncbi:MULTISPECIES: PTS system mannose/fructose/N-acetylgalactosamine-transporter subunit IIB [Tissierellales]|jgi:mannose/fructose/N-acetylgalactosamine-specific phosphotransferase system component IIB|uniref:PTS mannose/fructose/sorbose transporter subunit IIB n=1 Tax=Acidilutibacter cellobiosedens TaxID=2507161 RepID=A0A410Q9Z8_9FIRM|nr:MULTISPECIES: PTS sugar transporter subunit IIB [Tissierellales]MBE6081577.1 PTS sugar transporter subunit IIB [Tissierellaceae bacterium]QAT60789.1 PTS mannose/fructose/sorbose transporter subunit IIB [Acidilutibacter cellobiosedens]SCL87675.1 EIIAB-Man [Sporanaerobacter sp. PP17-6a]
MADIRLIRVDFRLMHGQVIANWLNQVDGNAIMIVNKQLSKDPFMNNVYKMAAPKGVKVSIFDLDTALEKIKSEKYTSNRKLIVLFKSVTDAKEAYEKGFPISELQVGGLGSGPDRVQITNQIYLNKEDTDKLLDMNGKGVKVYLQAVPKESELSIDKAAEKVK